MTNGEPETVVSASLQKIKSIKNPIKHVLFYFYFIKFETSDSFVNHFDGHFAYLKTLDFYFNKNPIVMEVWLWYLEILSLSCFVLVKRLFLQKLEECHKV